MRHPAWMGVMNALSQLAAGEALENDRPAIAGGHDLRLAFREIAGLLSAPLPIESFEPPVNYAQVLQYEEQRYPAQNADLERMYDRHALTPPRP